MEWKTRAASFHCSKLSLSILTIHLYECITISECLYYLKTINKKAIASFIPLILDNNFSMSNKSQIYSSVVARHKASFLLAFKSTAQNVLFFVQLFYITIYYFILYKQTYHLQIWLEREQIKISNFKLG